MAYGWLVCNVPRCMKFLGCFLLDWVIPMLGMACGESFRIATGHLSQCSLDLVHLVESKRVEPLESVAALSKMC